MKNKLLEILTVRLRSNYKEILAIFIIALSIRMIIFAINPYYWEPSEDSAQYDSIAWNLLSGRGYSMDNQPPYQPTARRPPVYPLFLAAVYQIIGRDYRGAKLIQAFIDSITCVLLYLIARRVLNKRQALVAGILIAIWPSTALFSNHLLSETIFTFFISLVVLSTYKILETKNIKFSLITGILIGIAALSRPDALLLPVFLFIPLFILLRNKRGALYFIGGILAFILTITPWTVRNYAVFGKVIPLTDAKTTVVEMPHYIPDRHIYLEYLFGSKERADKFRHETWEEKEERQQREVEAMKKTSKDVNPYNILESIRYKLLHPLPLVKKSIFRFYVLWRPSSWGDAFGLDKDFITYFQNKRYLHFSFKALLLLMNMTAIGFGWIGMFLYIKRWRTVAPLYATIIYFVGVYCSLHATIRYRVPIMPYILMFAVYAIFTLRHSIFGKFKISPFQRLKKLKETC